MIRIAIVEDQDEASEQLRGFIGRYAQEASLALHIERFPTGDDFLDSGSGRFELVMLDIEMPGLNGIQTAERIRESDPSVILVFVTNMAQYAVRGYKVDALDYLLKPITYPAFSECLTRALNRMRPANARTLTIATRTASHIVSTERLAWIESRGHRLVYHTDTGVIESTASSLAELEASLSDAGFLRTAKGYLVNLDRVRTVDAEGARIGEDVIPISRSRRRAFMDALITRVSGGMR